MLAVGVDIGGTGCAVSLGEIRDEAITVIRRGPERATAEYAPLEMIDALAGDIRVLCRPGETQPAGIGISCGGPLDSERGLVLSPPNLPGWDRLPIVQELSEKTGLPARLCNDANAGALAEWLWGAGRGCRSMIFLTFGTGMGAGLIFNGSLYSGASDSAGEVGHIRLEPFGPVGFGKAGSFEGFCSGGGIAQLARTKILEKLQAGVHPALCPDYSGLASLTSEKVGLSADKGDALAQEILALSGHCLGRGLALLIDLLNPEKIVIGGIFPRCERYIRPYAVKVLQEEVLGPALSACEIVPAQLGENIGDIAALTVAFYFLNN